MREFRDFNIKPKQSPLTGDKIKIDRVLNIKIMITDYRIEPSNKKPGTECLTLQIKRNDLEHIIFTGSTYLIDAIRQIPKSDLPFNTTIIKENECYKFT